LPASFSRVELAVTHLLVPVQGTEWWLRIYSVDIEWWIDEGTVYGWMKWIERHINERVDEPVNEMNN
jgi:hypothetical protein